MISTSASTPPHSLEAANVMRVAQLCPDIPDPYTKAVRGLITITWPYNAVRNTFAFILAEPDFRLRRNRGQVRIDFTGRAAKVAGECGLASHDEVLLSLEGATWESEVADRRRSLPGADLEWRLLFSESFSFKIKRAETGKIDIVVVNEQSNSENVTRPDPTPIQPLANTKSPSPFPISPVYVASSAQDTDDKNVKDGEFASPAFIKRARMSYGSLFEGGFDIFEEDGGMKGKGRKRTRFGRGATAWRYTSQSLSPEPAASSSEDVETNVGSPSHPVGYPTRVEMVDEGCQVMELDQSPPQSTDDLRAQTSSILSNDVQMNALPSGMAHSSTEQREPTPHLNGQLSESIAQVPSVLASGNISALPLGASLTHPEQPSDPPGYCFVNRPSDTIMTSSNFESQNQAQPLHLHMDVPFLSSGFANSASNTHLTQFHELNNVADKPHPDSDRESEYIGGDAGQLAQFNPPAVIYHSLDVAEEARTNPIHHEALTNYPTIHLDDRNTLQTGQMLGVSTSGYPAVDGLHETSWAIVNHSSLRPEMSPADRSDNRNGGTAEQTVIIDESDSASDSNPELMTANTVHDGHFYAMGTYEVAEDDEADAQYSDDDELEYDEEEMGDDYDARNYENPDDDDDDSHDDDLRPHSLEPELDDEDSWDEDEQGAFDEEEYESESDGEIADPPPRITAAVTPTVIDLISSSEDESENEAEGDRVDKTTVIQPSSAHVSSRVSPHRQLKSTANLPYECFDEKGARSSNSVTSQVETFSEADRDVCEHVSSHGEEEADEEEIEDETEDENEGEIEYESEDEDEEEEGDGVEGENLYEDDYEYEEDDDEEVEDATIKDEDRVEASQEVLEHESGSEIQEIQEREVLYMHENPKLQAEQPTKVDIEFGPDAGPDGNAALDSNRDREDISNQTNLLENVDTPTTRGMSEQVAANQSLSAADGLEMLSRAFDEESNSNNHTLSTTATVEAGMGKAVEPFHDNQSLARSTEEDDVQMQDFSNYHDQTISDVRLPEAFPVQSDETHQIDPIISSNLDTEHRSSAIDESKYAAVAPSSPPSTQSERLHMVDEEVNSGKGAFSSASDTVTARLPTPLDSQITDVVLEHTASTSVNLAESPKSRKIVQLDDLKVGKTSTAEDSTDRLPHQDMQTSIDKSGIEQQADSVLTSPAQDQVPPDESSAAVLSPARSFETQVEDGEPASSAVISQEPNASQVSPRFNLKHGSSALDTRSLTSYMEIDEELQASILISSQFEDASDLNQSIPGNANGKGLVTVSSGPSVGLDYIEQVKDTSSPLHENNPEKQIAEDVSAQVLQNPDMGSSSAEVSDTWMDSPSVHLARLSLASKRAFLAAQKDGETITHEEHEQKIAEVPAEPESFSEEGSISAEDSDIWTENPSVYLARLSIASRNAVTDGRRLTAESEDTSLHLAGTSLASQTSKVEEDSSSMAAAKLQLSRHLRDELFDCASLKILRQHLTKSLDVIAVATMQPPEPRRAKGGPREFMMSFTISDHSIGPHGVAEVLLYRPYKDTLPVIKYGDIVLLRNFTVVSLANKGFGLRSNEESSWAVFDYEDEPAQIRGPPVEYGECEILYVGYLREWFRLLDAKARANLERANQNIINARKPK
ncbi:hypothetical protein GGS21DRAFT_497508 [Xylaria nigripes]|nr:hypothetical protein GGS21DRAFT_497508 [Xylaria nigripes]